MTTQLKKARMEAGYSLEEIANTLNIRKQYLIALEEGNFDILPGQVYIDGYLRLYAKYLGVNLFEQVKDHEEPMVIPNNLTNEKTYKKTLIIISIIMLGLIIMLYNSITNVENDVESISTIENSDYSNKLNYNNENNF